MRSKNTIIALTVAIILAILSYIVLAFVGLGGERGDGVPIRGGFYLQESASTTMDELEKVYYFRYCGFCSGPHGLYHDPFPRKSEPHSVQDVSPRRYRSGLDNHSRAHPFVHGDPIDEPSL